MKYEIKYAIKKFEEIYTDSNDKPTCICKYVDDDGKVVEKEDITKELFHQVVKIDDETFQSVVGFGTYGFTETSLDTMTAREFINEYLIPITMKLNKAIERKFNPKPVPKMSEEDEKKLQEILKIRHK